MHKIRTALIAVLGCLALTAMSAPVAGAADGIATAPKVSSIPPMYTVQDVTGVAKNGKRFKGTYAIDRFVAMGDKVVAVGTLQGRLKGRKVTRRNVAMPAQLTGDSAGRAAQVTCPVLHLVLGPVNLNLLGLKVTLGGGLQANQPIVLDITAQQGGGLLGDLLCGVTNLLNQNGLLSQLNSQLQNLATTLNSIISLLGGLQGGR
jgi:hypothetical protein